MNEEYIYQNGQIIIYRNGKPIRTINYQDNYEKILVCENAIYYLKTKAINDALKLNELIKLRQKHVRLFNVVAPLTTGAFIGGTISFSKLITLLAGNINFSTILGDITITNAFLTIAIPISALTGVILSTQILNCGPSKASISAYKEMIRYEQEAIQSYEKELSILKSENNKFYEHLEAKDTLRPVIDRKMLRILRELRDLRASYGEEHTFYLDKKPDKLRKKLIKAGYLPESIDEFIAFLENEKHEMYKEQRKLKYRQAQRNL